MQKKISFPVEMLSKPEGYTTEKVAEFMTTVAPKMIKLFVEKDTDYNGSFANRGMISATLNLERKMDRVNSLFYSGRIADDSPSENIVDTYIDLANYALMNLWALGELSPAVKSQIEEFINPDELKDVE
ncbi:nucleotide modification associated domain 1 protein [Maribacter phage Molly_5]|uniref:Nucleotide modification associated domain 1 protein n=1 Tax=Maribacter phage Molly_1 TaxID=2745685 RepID=A0A8E4UY65_9CAUD|nr:nucleotide modification associated domain 1 protein [Maribacter phage Molly_1]QQO97601.1 nucleotide modification associated domain 1 protein [Maribacter phage Molly_2]QQO97801.1 nucleotide modification associated domain 1 protein [Maribacter phage Molly_3]QQO98002.1 nucleotide modification associated domain 1 protein [Maribacter phage Molly_4]QQO98202.1 nucleotide modification associated domain 1 protein [Maribacter phage Molly_5]QQO97401.1 nucleotide modification associated domain 1 protei